MVRVVRLDRWGRSLPHLVQTLTALDERGIGFRSLQDGIDTTTDTGRMVYGLMSVLSEFELSLIRSRTRAGLARAAALGHRPGPKPKLSPEQVQVAKRLYNEGEHTVCPDRGHARRGFPRHRVSGHRGQGGSASLRGERLFG